MPKTEVYQLRLTSDEKAELAYAASMNGGSIAKLIRDTFGLGDRSYRKVSVPLSGPGKSTQLSKLIKQLEAQGNPEAEEVARKRLGM